MSCCQGSCSCGKGDRSPVEENIHLVQLPTNQGVLSSFDWTNGPENLTVDDEVVEIRFKSNRKVFYSNRIGLELKKDDRIVVETNGGHDLGTVSLSGSLARKRFEQQSEADDKSQLKKIYRLATQDDIDIWLAAKKRERNSLQEARRIVSELGLDMGIGDVEFQGDGQKATLYFNAERREELGELVRLFASTLRVKVEMRQTGII
jgi:cell fate regulator YaaT (PSP1 superfamily)